MPPLAELEANALPSASTTNSTCTKSTKPRYSRRRSEKPRATSKRTHGDSQSVGLEPIAAPPRKKRIKAKHDVSQEYNVEEIILEGETEEAVPIYDTCDDIRSKIREHLALSGMTQAAFLRQLCKCFPQPKKLQSRQLKLFLELTGSVRGCESAIYYGAYVYFEKLRIINGEAKSTKRLELEEDWESEGGMSRKRDRQSYIVMAGTAVYVDEYGHIFTGPALD
jgi:hypothetical protein